MGLYIDFSNPKEVKNFTNKIIDQLNKIIPEIMNELSDDIKQQFQEAITDYYSYKTHMYIRVGQDKPYTGTGNNLYNAIDVYTKDSNGNYTIHYDFDYNELESHDPSYTSKKGEKFEISPNDDEKTILNMIMDGERYNVGDWDHDYNSKNFKLKGTLKEVIEQISDQFSDVAEEKILENFDYNNCL